MQFEVPPSANPSRSQSENRDPLELMDRASRSDAHPSASGSPLLDKECTNLPKERKPNPFNRQQWLIRRAVLDCLRYWQWNGYQCLWVTLTSARGSTMKSLRSHFQTLRKRISRHFGFGAFEYFCVDTLEGNGVLHMIWAYKDPDPQRKASFYIPFDWLQSQWKDIHGAFHVNVKRIGNTDKDSRRLSRYIVAQYCGSQCGLVRMSQSRMAVPLRKMRQALLRSLRGANERYFIAHEWVLEPGEDLGQKMNTWFWNTFRTAWDQMVIHRWCNAFGIRFAWINGQIERV